MFAKYHENLTVGKKRIQLILHKPLPLIIDGKLIALYQKRI